MKPSHTTVRSSLAVLPAIGLPKTVPVTALLVLVTNPRGALAGSINWNGNVQLSPGASEPSIKLTTLPEPPMVPVIPHTPLPGSGKPA